MAQDSVDLKNIFETIIPFSARSGIKAIEISATRNEIMMPLKPNTNHVGTMYAGALFTVAEMMGGAVAMSKFGPLGLVPIVKGLNIKFLKPAKTDITVIHVMTEEESNRIINEANTKGKSDYILNLELKDTTGLTVATSEGFYQVRKMGK
jgi:thioesterase domain-containing protein